jgi:hypothetical protein
MDRMSRRQSYIRFLFALKILLSEREFVKSWLRIVLAADVEC